EDRGSEASGDEAAQEEGIAALQRDVQRFAGAREELVGGGLDRRAGSRWDDRVGAEIACSDRSPPRRATRGERGDDLVLAESFGDEVVGDLAGDEREGGIHFVLGQIALHVSRRALAEEDLDPRIRLAEPG